MTSHVLTWLQHVHTSLHFLQVLIATLYAVWKALRYLMLMLRYAKKLAELLASLWRAVRRALDQLRRSKAPQQA